MALLNKYKKLNKKLNVINYIFAILLIFIIIAIIIRPKYYINSAANGLVTFGTKVFPSLFPFFVLTKILIELNVLDGVSHGLSKITRVLFGCPGESAYVFVIGLLCGYPVSAKITSDLFLNGKIDSCSATKIASFTSTSGPMFVIGTVGAAMFNSAKLGALILLCHALGAVVTGLIFCNVGRKKVQKLSTQPVPQSQVKISTAINNSMFSSINSVLVVGGFIVVFFVLIDVVFSMFNLSGITRVLVGGGIEMTRGLIELTSLMLPFNLNLIIGTFLISFGGFSIIMQAYYFLSMAHVKLSKFMLIKIVHALSATLIAFLISLCL